ncbi:MAG: ATP-binding protein [Deltaproteobacteria bacterium]|nr:ATP-binding protein [Deltaproteobacteria bacterium]
MNKPKRLPHLKFSLLIKFSLISFFLLMAIAIALGWGIQWHLKKNALKQESENAAEQVTTILNQNLRLADLSRPLDPNRYAQIDKLIRQNILGRHIVRVKIWNLDGVVVYSDAKDLVGRRFPVEGELREALAGKIAMEISDLRKEENVAERGHFRRLMEIYVPLRPIDSPQVAGAYEIYHDLSPLESHLTKLRLFIWASIGLGFVILYGLLFTIVRSASRELIRRNDENMRLYENAKQAEAEIQRNYDTQTMISSILRLSLEDISLEEIMKRALDIILSIPWLAFEKRGCIFLVEDAPEVLVMKAQSNLSNEIKTACAQVPFGRCLCGRAAMNQQTYFADCIDDSHEIGYKGIIPHGHYCVPIIFGSRTLGVLNIYVKEGHIRNQREEEFLSGITNTLAGIILRNQAQKEMATLQEQLRQSQKMEAIGQLAGGIAHDFNNLLTIMKGHSQLALMNLKEGEPLRGSFEEIEKATTKSANLVRQILAFSRRQVMEMIVLDLNTLLRDLEKMLRRIIGEDIGLLTVLADDLGRVKADPGQIEQVVLNLAVNARDAMPQGGKLTIETANVELDEAYARSHVAVTPGRYVMLAVSDTGVGMTPEIRERVFEPFFTTKEKGKGTGLGLATVYGIVKQSGGNIWLYSEPGQGTTFKIYLPRVDEPLAKEREKEEIGLFRGVGVILVVEDEEGVRKLVLEMLKKQGYSVLEADDEEEALLICRQYKDTIHLMVTDVVMPRISGPELAKRLVVFHPEMKVLYMSGYADNAIVHHGVLTQILP